MNIRVQANSIKGERNKENIASLGKMNLKGREEREEIEMQG